MNNVFDELRSQLPHVIGLGSHVPERNKLPLDAFDPSTVHSASDLPPYLILGELEEAACQFSDLGWIARWQGLESNTHFDITYERLKHCYVIKQTWCGIDGSYTVFKATRPLDQIILQGIYADYPSIWDSEGKNLLESRYQLTFIEHQEKQAAFCYLPDGPFKTIAFPTAAYELKSVFKWLQEAPAALNLPYPINAHARLLFQAVNFRENHAPTWTTDSSKVFNTSIQDTGLVPLGLPVREPSPDGSAAWTLRREIYMVFLTVPLAGLLHILEIIRSYDFPLNTHDDPELSFDLQPIIFPSGLDAQTENFTYWDKEKTTRCFWLFKNTDQLEDMPDIVAAKQTPDTSSALIEKTEDIGMQQLKALNEVLNS